LGEEIDDKRLEELLAALQGSPPLSAFSLALYRRRKAERKGKGRLRSLWEQAGGAQRREPGRDFLEKRFEEVLRDGNHSTCRFGGGLLAFIIPFSLECHDFCLLGDGVREQSVDLLQLSTLSRDKEAELGSLLAEVEKLPVTTLEEVEQRVSEAALILAELASPPGAADDGDSEQGESRLYQVADTLEQLDHTGTVAETIAIAGEVMVTQFKVQRLAVALRQGKLPQYEVSGLWGAPEDLGMLEPEGVELFFSRRKAKQTVLFDSRMRSALPGVQATLCSSFPLLSHGERLGFFLLLDTDLTKSDRLLISMVTRAVAATLSRLMADAERYSEEAVSERLMALTNSLLLVDNKEQLYEAVVGTAIELIDATQGSIMLIDKNGDSMQVVFTRGMTLNVAQSLPIKVGKGIAGKVAETGEALLVNDVEKDQRTAMANRPRFKSKSLLCVPLKIKNKTIGVLNLCEKNNLAPFTGADLQVITSFASLASLTIERALVLEESVRFEQLSVTDALTGLYNRRFLKSRLEEELNRSMRQGLELTVLFIDLDYFKSYNDLCGHIAGDEALKKTAEIIRGSLREMDIVARYGGEEFCAVLPDTAREVAVTVAERIRAEIEAEAFPGEHKLPAGALTASVGIASFPGDGRSFTALVHASDVALYEAKAAGRNRVVATMSAPATPQSSSPTGDEPAPETSHPAKTVDFSAYLEASLRSKNSPSA
jgi:diguanylate cyclase (GGDEF)-like protein